MPAPTQGGGAATAVRDRAPQKATPSPKPASKPAPKLVTPAPAAPYPDEKSTLVVVQTGSPLTNFFMRLEWQTVAYFAVFLVALFTRFYDLGAKPLHHDESIHAYYSYKLFKLEGYQYDPTYHGPFLYHANALVYFLFGDSDYTCRVLPAVFGMVLVALPFFFREWLGKTGALMVGLLMTISPTVTYVSRFIRDDIYQEACALILLVCFFKWLRTRKRWLIYAAAAALAVSYASMEATFMTMFIFGTFLFLWYLWDTKLPPGHWPYTIGGGLAFVVTSCLAAVVWGGHDLKPEFWDGGTIALFLLGFGFLFGAFVFFYRFNKNKKNDFLAQLHRVRVNVSANKDYVYYIYLPLLAAVLILVTALRWRSYNDPFPQALAAGLAPTVVIGALLAAVTFYFEDLELACWSGVIFALIYIPLYSTLFTNPKGLADGVTTALTYWLHQHNVKRGNQPLNFYPFLTLVYELAPALLSLIASAYFFFRKNVFAYALMWWTVMSVALYNWAGEKMPWLLVHMAVPGILLSGYYLGQVIDNLTSFRKWVILPVTAALCTYSVHQMIPVNYYWPADPIEPLVYTQSSADLIGIVKQIDKLSYQTTGAKEMHMTIIGDATWPFPWYLRDYKYIAYPADNTLQPAPGETNWHDTPILISQDNADWPRVKGLLGDKYEIKRYHHREWWITQYADIVPGFVDIHTFQDFTDDLANARWFQTDFGKLWKFLMYREIWNPKGSVDLYFCVQKGLEHKFN